MFIFLEPDDVVALHAALVRDFGGMPGLKDAGMLESALMRPVNKLHYEGADLFTLAAAYLYGLCCNHAFHDGNKRIAVTAAALFLETNGRRLTCTSQQLEEITQQVAAGTASEDEAIAFLKKHSRPDKADRV